MAIVRKVYICETCGAQFNDLDICKKHEFTCKKCNFCKNAYYVYGCEFACKYDDAKECCSPNWEYFEEKIGN